jgi:hypothetical protein
MTAVQKSLLCSLAYYLVTTICILLDPDHNYKRVKAPATQASNRRHVRMWERRLVTPLWTPGATLCYLLCLLFTSLCKKVSTVSTVMSSCSSDRGNPIHCGHYLTASSRKRAFPAFGALPILSTNISSWNLSTVFSPSMYPHFSMMRTISSWSILRRCERLLLL